MKFLLFLIVLALGGGIWWKFRHQEPPDISEDQAKEIAENAKLDFCGTEKAMCLDFASTGQQPPADPRFHWAFRYLNQKPDPWQKIVVSVGKKGDHSLEYVLVPVGTVTERVVGAPAEAPPAP